MEIIRSTETPVAMIERDGKNYISGWGAIYYDGTTGSEYQIGDNLYERFARGAFDRAIAEGQDIKARYNWTRVLFGALPLKPTGLSINSLRKTANILLG